MPKLSNRESMLRMLGSLGWPVFLGAWATVLLYLVMLKGPLDHPLLWRFLAGHPVSYIETGLAVVGVVALLFKAGSIAIQFRALSGMELAPIPPHGQAIGDTERLLDDLEEYPPRWKQSYLGRRLRDALQSIQRSGSAAQLDGELKYLSDMDAARQQDSYGLVRIVIWATPMLGFLGTVMGITQALGDLNPAQLASDVQNAMKGLLAGLYVAFDTTALALMLSMALMFLQFVLERFESHILSAVDIRASEELIGRFSQVGAAHDPHVASVERMGQAVIRSVETLVARQADVWRETISAAHERWSKLVGSSTEQVQGALAGALNQSLLNHAAELAKFERAAAEQARIRWQEWQLALTESARLLHAQQKEMTRQGELMGKAIEATGNVIQLEQALNSNLSALAGSKNFEDTVMSLAAAIHLLNTRLSAGTERHVDLARGKAA
jgi:biopolymer transport protein ExbB/TolQ